MKYYVYILSNWKNNVLYIGMTNNLERRLNEHKGHRFPGFTDRYNVTKLVYLEECQSVLRAIAREKQLKGWRREKKEELISSMNPQWSDLLEITNEEK